jgi:hypothetical protein
MLRPIYTWQDGKGMRSLSQSWSALVLTLGTERDNQSISAKEEAQEHKYTQFTATPRSIAEDILESLYATTDI